MMAHKGSVRFTLHTAGPPEIWIDQSGLNKCEDVTCADVKLTGKAFKSSNFSHWR